MSFSVFDIAGPIMVGPSSSHTAGACKIGQFARALFNKTPKKVTFRLHGSFASVYRGHATDRALLAGILKLKTSDPRLKNAFALAKQQGIQYHFETVDLGPKYHPNSVEIILEAKGKNPLHIIGSSIGGGNVVIVRIADFDVEISSSVGKYKTLVCVHEPRHGIFEKIRQSIEQKKIRVADVKQTQPRRKVFSILNLEGRMLTLKEVLELEKIPGVSFVRSLHKLN